MKELNEKYLAKLQELIDKGSDDALSEQLSTLHPTDIAEVLNQLKPENILKAYKLLSDELKSEVLVDLHDEIRDGILNRLTSKEIAEDVIEGLVR